MEKDEDKNSFLFLSVSFERREGEKHTVLVVLN